MVDNNQQLAKPDLEETLIQLVNGLPDGYIIGIDRIRTETPDIVGIKVKVRDRFLEESEVSYLGEDKVTVLFNIQKRALGFIGTDKYTWEYGEITDFPDIPDELMRYFTRRFPNARRLDNPSLSQTHTYVPVALGVKPLRILGVKPLRIEGQRAYTILLDIGENELRNAIPKLEERIMYAIHFDFFIGIAKHDAEPYVLPTGEIGVMFTDIGDNRRLKFEYSPQRELLSLTTKEGGILPQDPFYEQVRTTISTQLGIKVEMIENGFKWSGVKPENILKYR